MKAYDHKKIEKKWQEEWEKKKIYKAPDTVPGKENYFTLVEFSYPSGNLHVGHWYAFAVPDILVRFKRMQGYNVMYPMGFDAFGLPAENAAIKLGKDPKTWTYSHMEKMRDQLRSMGASFDWDREIVSCDPSYYKWTQWMFSEFFENNLAYRAQTTVNWCPKDKTILANEQVVDGTCERCGEQVEQRKQEQWMLRITKFADALVDDLESLDWPHAIKEAQRNWIGRSEGSEIDFSITDSEEKIKVFTTRADTLFGVTYVVLAPEHSLVDSFLERAENKEEIVAYIDEVKRKSELDRQQLKEKTGVEIKGVRAINPANNEKISVWIADYVLPQYGTGAVMAVPAHDERDFEFAKKYSLPCKKVIESDKDFFSEDGILVDSGEFSGFSSNEARKKITEYVKGTTTKNYRLRDWGISRQRYWGVPIPIVYDPEGKPHAIGKEHLPWLLPEDVDHTPDGTAPLARSKELFLRTEKIFGKGWTPEVETMDTFVDSSWYFYRYLDSKNENDFCSKETRTAWLPIDLYMGGAEHTTMHVLYSRFWTKALRGLGLVENTEEFTIRRNRGLILGPDGNKMSKSRGNVIDPDEVVERLGADTVRMYLAFMGPYGTTANYPWDPNGVVGVRRFLERSWGLFEKVSDTVSSDEAQTALHKAIAKVGEDIVEYKFNTAIAAMMICLNVLEKESSINKDDLKKFIQILAPFAPHMSEEIWALLGEEESIHLSDWPVYDPTKLVSNEMTIAIQVNGKVRAEIIVERSSSKEKIEEQAIGLERIQEFLKGQHPKKIIYVPGRLVNIVV